MVRTCRCPSQKSCAGTAGGRQTQLDPEFAAQVHIAAEADLLVALLSPYCYTHKFCLSLSFYDKDSQSRIRCQQDIFWLAWRARSRKGSGGRNVGARSAYANGPLAASLAWSDVKKDPTTFADGTSRNNTKALQLAVAYDFESVKVFTHLGTINSDGSATADCWPAQLGPAGQLHYVQDVGVSVRVGRPTRP